MSVASRSIDPDLPDIDTERACQVLGLSKELIYRLARRGEIEGYVLCGKRFWVLQSLRDYRERCRAAGLQFAPPDQRRKRGRPRLIKTKQSATAAE